MTATPTWLTISRITSSEKMPANSGGGDVFQFSKILLKLFELSLRYVAIFWTILRLAVVKTHVKTQVRYSAALQF